jgi:NYN domain/OST-HTH/LOTUS domain
VTDRVAVYIDFDNVVISRYDNLHGDGAWRKDEARHHRPDLTSADSVDVKLAQAEVDLGAIIDYAASFGVVAMTRAYADWSVPANAAYKKALVDRAVDLVQLFAAAGTKNGADIRLAVDAVEDLSNHRDITHVTLVAGDSDYVPLAQRCKRLGRFVVGIGVAGSTSRALVNACDEFQSYEALPGLNPQRLQPPAEAVKKATATARKSSAKKSAAKKSTTPEPVAPVESNEPVEQTDATALLVRAARVGLQKSDDEWVHSSSVKSQMQRMAPEFKEKALGYPSFRAFVESRSDILETKQLENGQLLVRLK